MNIPMDPIVAVTHPEPYPYYAQLAASQPLYRDPELGMWVVSSADAVTAVLTSDLCRVRPAAEPVPAALLRSPAGDIFHYLVRMTDGGGHAPLKAAVSAALASLNVDQVVGQSSRSARDFDGSQDFVFDLSVHVLGSLLGIPQDRLQQTALWMGDFVYCLAPASTPDQIERGKLAAGHLRDMFHGLLADQQTGSAGLLGALAREIQRAGLEDVDLVAANGIGFLWQGYEATAGLIGNAFLALATHPEVRDEVMADSSLLPQFLREVLRYDAPIQNTRRFVSRDGIISGQKMEAGDVILVVLAAANRDPAANPNPDRFDMFRKDRRTFSFGAGVHACPGDSLAIAIAQAGIIQLLATGIDPIQPGKTVTYYPSANARIPILMPLTEARRSSR